MEEMLFASVVVKEVTVPGSPATATPSIIVRVIKGRSRFRVDAEVVQGRRPVILGPGRYDHETVDAALMFASRRLPEKFPLVDVGPISDAAMEAALSPQADPDFLSPHDDPTVVRAYEDVV